MNLKIILVALSLAMAVPAMAQTTDSTPDGCHGAAAGTVLSDGTVCPAGGTGTLGSNITPLMGGDDDSDGVNEGAEHQNSATHTENSGTDNDSASGNDDNSSDHDSASGNDDNGTDHDSASGNDDTGSDHDSDSDNGDDD